MNDWGDRLEENIKPDNYFFLKNGTAIRNLDELHEQLAIMDDEVFSYHVNDQKNDFCSWIRDVLKDEGLAELLAHAGSKEEAARLVKERLSQASAYEEEAVVPLSDVPDELEPLSEKSDDVEDDLERISEKIERKQTRRQTMLEGLKDFLLGFILGAIAMLILEMFL